MTREEALEVYKVQHEKLRHTKNLQWKVNLVSWALIAFGIKEANNLKKQELEDWILLLFLSLYACAQFIYSWRTQRALEKDKTISKNILTELNKNSSRLANI